MNMVYKVEGDDKDGNFISVEVEGDNESINHLCWRQALLRGIDDYTMTFVRWIK